MPLAAPPSTFTDLDQLSINTLRFLAVDAVEHAQSGHPGMPMGAAPMAYVLWTRHLQHNPNNPHWPNRDRFVLSAGHGSMLLYGLLHLTGYDLPMEQLKAFRQWGSKTPGHPENFVTAGVETTTGPLGQGFANGVGFAIAERWMAAQFNTPTETLVDHHTYGIVSDGDLMEGVAAEAASLAGHLGLGKLIYLYDDNEISIDGSTDLAFTEDVAARFEAYGWQVLDVADGNDLEAIDAALVAAKADTERPSLIVVHTIIGFGSPNKQGTAASHGSPLGPDEVDLAKQTLGWPEAATFHVPEAVREHLAGLSERGTALEDAWTHQKNAHAEANDTHEDYLTWLGGGLRDGWETAVPTFDTGTKLATRASSGHALNAIAPVLGNLIGGSADLTGSNKTAVKGWSDFQRDTPEGSYFRFGVREHAMAAICNGIALHSGLRPFCGTFLIFSDYLRPALRLSALMELPVTYVFTHDSIGLGEDGPTHQPVEHYMALRAIPNLTFIRPADANETAEAWRAALRRADGPTALALTRQKLPTFDRSVYASAEGLHRGAYVMSDSDGTPDVILMASGSEVELIVDAAQVLREAGVQVRVVSVPSWELFDAQEAAYRAEVLPPAVTRRVAVEAGITQGWERYTGLDGRIIGVDHFGASAPYETLYREFGLTVEAIVEAAQTLMHA